MPPIPQQTKALEALIEAANAFDAFRNAETPASENGNIRISHPIPVVDLAIIANEMQSWLENEELIEKQLSYIVPKFSCPKRTHIIGSESGLLMSFATEAIDLDWIADLIEAFEETTEMWVLEDDKVVEHQMI